MIALTSVRRAVTFLETGSEVGVAARGWRGGGAGGCGLMVVECQLCKVQTVLEMNGGDGGTNMWVYPTSERSR